MSIVVPPYNCVGKRMAVGRAGVFDHVIKMKCAEWWFSELNYKTKKNCVLQTIINGTKRSLKEKNKVVDVLPTEK